MGINNEMDSFSKIITEKKEVLTHVLKLLKSIDCYQFDLGDNVLCATCEPGFLYFNGFNGDIEYNAEKSMEPKDINKK